jgi:hypothetical protein
MMHAAESDCGPEVGSTPSGSRRAATGVRNDRGARPQTVEDHDRRFCRRRPLTWRLSRVFPGPQRHAVPCRNARYRSRTEEARGSNPLTSTPTLQVRASPARCWRRSRHVPAAVRPQLKSQSSPEGSQKREGLGPRPHHDHAAWSPPAADRRAILARIPLLRLATRSTWPTAHHRPRRRPSRSRPAAGPAQPVPASRARLQPRADDAPSWTRRATTPTPAIPAVRAAGPTATPYDLIPVGHNGRRRPDTGHLDAPDARTGHRSPGQAPRDTGHSHRTPDRNADTVTTAQSASGPPWPPRRATAR